MLALRHSLAALIVSFALVAIGGVFLFARPHYGDPRSAGARTIDLTGFARPDQGWSWKRGQPGYRFGVREEDWNQSNLRPAELAAVERVARRLGLRTVRPLIAERYGPHRLGMIVAATGRAGRTCLGFALPERAPWFACPRDAAAFVAVVPNHTGAFMFGIARADVASVNVQQGGRQPAGVFGIDCCWGTFSITLAGRHALMSVGRRRVPLALDAASPYLLRVAG